MSKANLFTSCERFSGTCFRGQGSSQYFTCTVFGRNSRYLELWLNSRYLEIEFKISWNRIQDILNCISRYLELSTQYSGFQDISNWIQDILNSIWDILKSRILCWQFKISWNTIQDILNSISRYLEFDFKISWIQSQFKISWIPSKNCASEILAAPLPPKTGAWKTLTGSKQICFRHDLWTRFKGSSNCDTKQWS